MTNFTTRLSLLEANKVNPAYWLTIYSFTKGFRSKIVQMISPCSVKLDTLFYSFFFSFSYLILVLLN